MTQEPGLRNGPEGSAEPGGHAGPDTTALAAAVERLLRLRGLPPDLAPRMHALLGLLADPEAPTAVHDPAVGVGIHLADSLIGLEVPELRRAGTIADLGAGAGLPGLALAVALPAAHVTLVESQGRKCAFLERAIGELRLANASVTCARAESLGTAARFDVVTSRAVASLAVLCEYAAPLLVGGGVLVAWKGAVDAEEDADGLAAAAALGLSRTTVQPVEPYDGSERRTLHIFRKVAPTPAGYPRRPGMAVKRPLRATVRS